MKKLLLILIIGFYFTKTNAQTNAFTLNDAVLFALENNSASKNASNDLEIAKAKKWETIATGLPQINAFLEYTNNIKKPVSLVPAEFFGGSPGEFSEISFGTKQTFDGSATLRQLLFSGSYTVGLMSIKLYLEIADTAKIKTDLEVKRNVISAYGNVLVSEERVKFLTENLKNVKRNLEEIQKIYENGLTELENVEQLTITHSSLKNSLEYATKLGKTSRNILKMIMGMPLNEKIVLLEGLHELTLKKINLNAINQPVSLDQNIDYQIAVNAKRSQEALFKYEKSQSLPTLSAFIKKTYMGYNESFDFLDSDQKWYASSLAGVTMSIPIFTSFKRSAKSQQAKIEVEKAKVDLKQTEQKILVEVENAQTNYQFAINQYYNTINNLELAKKIEKKNEIKFYEGLASSFDLRQAQNQLYTIQNELLQSMSEVINSKTNLEIILNEK
ncbi:MAG: TolC family protein [Flavobacteriaceae bacterium]|nr:TolC family protein [Flavobacteriaceae bacterium]